MYCLFCNTNLPEDTLFCINCGKPISKGVGEAEKQEHALAFANVASPSDPYTPWPSIYEGALPPEGNMQNSSAPTSPDVSPAPPPSRRFFPGFLKGFLGGVLVIVLLSSGLEGVLLLRQGALSPSIPLAVRSTTTSQTTTTPRTKTTPRTTTTPRTKTTSQPTTTSQTITTSQPTTTSQTITTSQPTATPQTTANTTVQSLFGTWTQCAVEAATCSFSGTKTVAFGADGAFNYATESNGTACTVAVFGDPINGISRACYLETAAPTTDVWTQCAAENATCSFLGTMTVAFGVNGLYKYATKTNGTACSDAVFGDPDILIVKACYMISPPTSTTTWHICAAENSTCSFTGKHEVAFGANGEYFYGSFVNGTACTVSVFGDPASGYVKACYYQ